MTAGAIRAGRAFVEMFIDDASVQASLENVKARLKTFGAAVDTIGSASFTRMNTIATASTVSTGASVGVLAATMGVLQASVYAVGVAFRTVFGYLTTSVLKAAALIGVLAATVSTYLPGSKLAGFLTNFMNKSQTTEALGRWTRFFGLLTGSSVIKDLGNRIERLGLGSAIVKGFQSGGITGGIGATLAAGIRSSRSIIAGAISGVFTAPFRAVAGLFRGAITSAGVSGANPLAATTTGAAQLATNLTRAATAGRSAAGALTLLKSVGATISGIATKVGGLAAAISGPALLAAKTFTTTASEMLKKSKETGESLAKLLFDKFGGGNLVTPEDIQSTTELTDLFKELKQSVAAAWAQIGIAALPVLTAITQRSIQVADAIGQFLSQNRQLITTIITVAAKVVSFTAGIVGLYGAFLAAVPVVTMLISPLGLVAVGIAAIAYLFPKLRAEAVSIFQYLFGQFSTLGTIVNETMQGMMDAMSGGSLKAAANVLWAGLKLAWLTGSENLRSIWRSMTTSMSSVFINLYAGILKGWVVVTSGFMSIWTATQNFIAAGMARLIAFWTGMDEGEILATLTEMQQQDQTDREAQAKKRLEEIEAERKANEQNNTEMDEEAKRRADQELKRAQEEFEAAKRAAEQLRRNKGKFPEGLASGLKNTATLGTFSVAAVGRTNIGGIADLKKATEETADNTKKIADNSDRNPFEWVT